MDQLHILKQNFQAAKKKQEDLEHEYKTCLLRKDRAKELIDGLASEKDNWTHNAVKAEEESKTVVGDCILSSGIIAYMGAFPIAYREEVITSWMQKLKEQNITFNVNYKLQEVLCDPITIGQWTNKYRLPNDSFSIDNAIIMKNSERFPLFIDPQQQANSWIKNMEGTDTLHIIKPPITPSEYQYCTNLIENCVQLGKSILLEKLSDTIDNIFDAVIKRQLIK